jgi:hypothetical protein
MPALGSVCGNIRVRAVNGPMWNRSAIGSTSQASTPTRSSASTASTAPSGAYTGSGGHRSSDIARARSSGLRSAQ